ncbi:MAG TPA: chemotaxis protein CheB [Candidatus Syntrophoarchaeum butanivorans]|uniref:protein-glutamate methylesterase n=1 Tax=Candidatus Syntropharchaeum butanivorans TaxID=1839936 RepID=A0A7C0X370_9EURY|nr:MAG: chemotaxis protein CheB [Candidatus Syntrophoarchaeum sp. WYZ-LMO15]HDM36571.1 chemotaxis protein CheB [Candidatus Syntrophoarchaeum butanivorans]
MQAERVIAIGASTGGLVALKEILSQLPDNIGAAVIIVQHMPSFIARSIVTTLNEISKLPVKLAEDGDILEENTVYLAPGGERHVVVENGRIRLVDGDKVNFCRPSVDVMMESIAREFGPRVVGAILTGMGHDGARGIAAIKERGGVTIAQDKVTSAVFGMPKAAIETGKVDHVMPSYRIASAIMDALGGQRYT